MPRLGNTDGHTQGPSSFTTRCDLVWEPVQISKVCQEEAVFELSSEKAKVAGERHSRPREPLVQRVGGDREHGVFRCAPRAWSAGRPALVLTVREKVIMKSERGLRRLLQPFDRAVLYLLTRNNQTLD